MIGLRIIPVAPFTIVNLVAGASHIRFKDFFIGTALGLIPGCLVLSSLVDQVLQIFKNPSTTTLITAALVIVGMTSLLLVTRKFVARKEGS